MYKIPKIINKSVVEEIRERGLTDLRGIFESRGFTFQRNNTNCFAHDDHTPSLSVTNDKGWHCHACGESGKDPIKLIQKLDNLTGYREAIEAAAAEFHVVLEGESHPVLTPKSYPKKLRKSSSKKVVKSLPLPDYVELALQPIPDDIPQYQQQGREQIIIYNYSDTQWVKRIEKFDSDGNRTNKHCYQLHLDGNGKEICKKGPDKWKPYRLADVQKFGQGKWVFLLEGEPCVETGRSLGLVSSTLQGSNWGADAIIEGLNDWKSAGIAGVIIWPDHDEVGIKKARKLQKQADLIGLPFITISPLDLWAEMPEKGDIVDWVKAHQLSSTELIAKIEAYITLEMENRKAQEQKIKDKLNRLLDSEHDDDPDDIDIPNWSQSAIAKFMAERYRPQLAWHTGTQSWYRYNAEIEGIWSNEPSEFVKQVILTELDNINELYSSLGEKTQDYTYDFISGTEKLLKVFLAVKRWDEPRGKLPLLNGVLDLKTKQLDPHSPGNRLTWCLPYNYTPGASSLPIIDWMQETVGDQMQVELLRAYLAAVIRGRTDLQRYLELIGPGGTGKSTYIRLAMALVGVVNTHITTLQKLEGSRFETACIHGKRLVVVTDSERYAGSVSVLKALTGQDPLPYERKFQNSTEGFIPNAMVVVAANEIIQSGDYTSGLERRRLTMWFNNQIPRDRQRNLIELTPNGLTGEFVDYIPGLLNWVLELSEDEITNFVKRTEQFVPALSAKKSQVLCDTNPLADWVDHCIVSRPNIRTQIGVAKRDKSPESLNCYQLIDQWLYASYCEFSVSTGTKPIAIRRFSNLLHDLLVNQLKLTGISKGKDRNGAYFTGLSLRRDHDQDHLLITGIPLDTTKFPNSPPNTTSQGSDPTVEGVDPTFSTSPQSDTITGTNVTANCHTCDGSVTAGSTGRDESDGCDGLSSNLAPDKTDQSELQDQVSDLSKDCDFSVTSITSITSEGSSHHTIHHTPEFCRHTSDEAVVQNSGWKGQKVQAKAVVENLDNLPQFLKETHRKIKGKQLEILTEPTVGPLTKNWDVMVRCVDGSGSCSVPCSWLEIPHE